MKQISDLSLRNITIIQVIIATIISLLYQFVFPLSWNPIEVALHGDDVNHGDPGTAVLISTISQWYFSLSIAWFIYRDNPYVNNFLIYTSLITAGVIIYLGFFLYYVYWDYIHILPFIVDIYILKKKGATLRQTWYPHYLILCSIWYFAVYFMGHAYFGESLSQIIFYWAIVALINLGISFTYYDSLYYKFYVRNH